MSHQELVLEALGMDNYDNALDLMKQIADEFIMEQENEDKLNNEIDALMDGVDFSEPLEPMDQNDSAPPQVEVSTYITKLNCLNILYKTYMCSIFFKH